MRSSLEEKAGAASALAQRSNFSTTILSFKKSSNILFVVPERE